MGAGFIIHNPRYINGEKVGDIQVHYKPLYGINITAKDIPSIIDELPILSVVATQAEGMMIISGAEELRYKESDRIKSIVEVCPDIIVRWLRSRHDPKASQLRWSMIENTKLNSRARSKLLEQMEGKREIDTQRLAIITEDDSALVRIAAMNLSAAFAELTGEDS